MSQLIEVKVPDIGDYQDIPVIEVLVKPGDVIEKEQSLITLESDKATMDVPSSHAGVVKEVKVKVGDNISEGGLVLLLEASGVDEVTLAPASPKPLAANTPISYAQSYAPAPPAQSHTPAPTQSHAPPPALIASVGSNDSASMASHASPSVRKFARELGVQVTLVKGSGPKGRITQEDVQAFIKSVMSATTGATSGGEVGGGLGNFNLLPWPKVDFTKFGEVERLGFQLIKKMKSRARK